MITNVPMQCLFKFHATFPSDHNFKLKQLYLLTQPWFWTCLLEHAHGHHQPWILYWKLKYSVCSLIIQWLDFVDFTTPEHPQSSPVLHIMICGPVHLCTVYSCFSRIGQTVQWNQPYWNQQSIISDQVVNLWNLSIDGCKVYTVNFRMEKCLPVPARCWLARPPPRRRRGRREGASRVPAAKVARWQNLILGPHALHPGAIQLKVGIKFCSAA